MNGPRSTKPGDEAPFCWASHAAIDRALLVGSTSGLAIYIALCRLHSEAPPQFKDSFFASEANIAAYCGLSPRRLRPILRELIRAKLITAQSAGRGPGGAFNPQARKFTVLKAGASGQNVRADESSVRTNRSTYLSDIKEESSDERLKKIPPPTGSAACGAAGRGGDGAWLKPEDLA